MPAAYWQLWLNTPHSTFPYLAPSPCLPVAAPYLPPPTARAWDMTSLPPCYYFPALRLPTPVFCLCCTCSQHLPFFLGCCTLPATTAPATSPSAFAAGTHTYGFTFFLLPPPILPTRASYTPTYPGLLPHILAHFPLPHILDIVWTIYYKQFSSYIFMYIIMYMCMISYNYLYCIIIDIYG